MFFLWIVVMGLSQEPHNKLVMMFECSSVLSGYPGHLGNFLIIVVKFFTRVRLVPTVWLVPACDSVCGLVATGNTRSCDLPGHVVRPSMVP